jgi:hypothetical protein
VSGAEVLLAEIRAAGADVGLDNGVLRVRVPKGVLTATQRERLVENHVAIIRMLTEPASGGTSRDMSRTVPPVTVPPVTVPPVTVPPVPVGDRYGPDEVVADLKTVFTVNGPASHAAADRLRNLRNRTSGPAGDDLPAWQSWMKHRYVWWRQRGFSQAEARRIAWGEAEWKWHLRNGPPPDPDRCAGCGKKIMAGDGMEMLDGAMGHVADPETVECLAIYGAQYRNVASVALMGLGLMRPQS